MNEREGEGRKGEGIEGYFLFVERDHEIRQRMVQLGILVDTICFSSFGCVMQLTFN